MLAHEMNGVFFGFLVPVFYIFAMKNPDGTTTEMFYGIHTEIGANLGNSLDINTSWEIATGWMYEDDDYGIMLILQWGIIRFRRKVERRKPKKVLTVWCKKKRKDLTKLFFYPIRGCFLLRSRRMLSIDVKIWKSAKAESKHSNIFFQWTNLLIIWTMYQYFPGILFRNIAYLCIGRNC